MSSSPPESQQTFPRSQLPTTTKLSPQSLPYSAPVDHGRLPENEHMSVAFVKGAKRKRLSKACDACHKSKRRCDGTAPCSNCYYASKNCTYTDAAGRPVPAPRNTNPERPITAAITTVSPTSEPPPWAGQATAAAPSISVGAQNGIERDPTSKRSRRGQPGSSASPTSASKSDGIPESYASSLLDPATTHELVQIFFAHCNPQRMIIHKPSFSSDLSLNKVPIYLLLAVCALAAPLHKTVASKASQARLAGVPYFQEALNLMFDNSGRLLSEPSVSTAQALCLLEMHEVAASHSWTRHFRYFELALQVLEGSLEVHQSDNTAPPSPTDADALIEFIERECTRRCFWLIQTLAWISYIYTRKPILPRMFELADLVRLPIDETTFELAVLSSSATSEYLRRPAPRTRYASQWGHTCRILEIYHNVESILATKEGQDRVTAIQAVKPALVAWFQSLPGHLQFNEENLETQVAMFETGSNSGAWCYCFMHAMYACCSLAIREGEGTLTDPIPWVREQLNMIFNAAGTRAKNSILSACALWSYSKYSPDDPQVQVWDRDFEKVWGFKVVLVADQWRQSQAMQRKSAALAAQQQQQQQAQQQQQQQQQMYQPREQPRSDTGSPPSAHSSPGTGAALPYDGHRGDGSGAGNPRALLRTHVSMSDLGDAAVYSAGAHAHTNLPSLKASGLLDSWKPPSETFASALSLGGQPSPPQPQHLGGGGGQGAPGMNAGVGGAAAPVRLDWLVDGGPRQ
ncbi:hypothetical protein PYCCODRAFT_1410100 [Trametes coccinea BRFM310]|uniref:Zn(2)-C6 fungal-type domain-containing protein n=1 Tax=Trametes coccinea (strain BRFM310) TaxID=1353009 RepID=A0A1Y2IR44_TRAC3|nr:hypothetical protein PYCCODRAFT_1410100 [Trametes coccinea BRFM310]